MRISSASIESTDCGTPSVSVSTCRPSPAGPARARRAARAGRGRTGCRPRRGRPRRARCAPGSSRAARPRPRASAGRGRRAPRGPRARRRRSPTPGSPGAGDGRNAQASSTGPSGGRRSSEATTSSDAWSAQCRSSSDEQQRAADGEPVEQLLHRAVRAVALGLERALGHSRAVERGEDRRQLGEPLAARALQPAVVEPGEVVVERVDEHAERQLALELRRAAGEHEPVALAGRAPTAAPSGSSCRSRARRRRRGSRGRRRRPRRARRPSVASSRPRPTRSSAVGRHPSRSCAGSASAGATISSGPSTPARLTAGFAGAAAVRAASSGREELERGGGVDVGRQPRGLGLGRAASTTRHAVVHRRADGVRGGGEDRHRRDPLVADAALAPQPREREQRAAVDRVAERRPRALRVLGPQPLVPAVGEHEAAVRGVADQRREQALARAASPTRALIGSGPARSLRAQGGISPQRSARASRRRRRRAPARSGTR